MKLYTRAIAALCLGLGALACSLESEEVAAPEQENYLSSTPRVDAAAADSAVGPLQAADASPVLVIDAN